MRDPARAGAPLMRVLDRIDAFQQRHRSVGLPLAVVYKYFDDQGNLLTALITYYGFLSLFPLLLLMVTILGFLLQGDPGLQQRVVDSALSQFPIIGDQIAGNITGLRGSGVAVAVGVVVSLYGGLGAAQAAQTALNKVWGVPRGSRPNPLMARLRSLLMLVIVGGGILLTTVLSALTTAAETYGGGVGTAGRIGAAALAVIVNIGLFMLAFRLLTVRAVTIKQIRGGAIAAAVIWQALQSAATFYLGHVLRTANSSYGTFALVLGLFAWIYLGALTLVLCAEVNAVRAERLWPRNLRTVFVDDVELTAADQRAYRSYATTERHKSSEHIEVTFDHPPSSPGPPDPAS
ncbi:MAG TPA: YihY/virulence factor BrkB family protein [Mycobacteriales bacterium]|nr:YihY/virulence factor BrkB family protein [Mycobacteriales bacterium]